jgi:hypothetical protein
VRSEPGFAMSIEHLSSSPNLSGDLAIACGNLPIQAGNCLSNTCTISRIRFAAIGDVALLNVFGSGSDLPGGIVEQHLALRAVHHSKQVTWLLIVVVIDTMVPMGRSSIDG